MEKRLLVPWEKEHTIICPNCGGRIKTKPLWSWEKQPSNIGELQKNFCHVLTAEFLEKIPVLSENDWKSKQQQNAFRQEFVDSFGIKKPYEEIEWMFRAHDGPPAIFREHGIFALIPLFTETELKVLFALLCLEPGNYPKQAWFKGLLQISRSHVSTILKKLRKWNLIESVKSPAKGRAKGRQLAYLLNTEARSTLDKDLQEHDFLREDIIEMLKPIADIHCNFPWRKDVFEPACAGNNLARTDC